jgi:pimeloyl-ACP methyl ester carboxylesterase
MKRAVFAHGGFYAFAATVLIAACGPAPASNTSPAPVSPLALAPCVVRGVAGECGFLRVFENRASQQGRMIDIRVMVIRADSKPAREAVFMLSGGPGTGSTTMAPVADGWARPVRASMDVVLIDQRGTGASHPLECPSPAQTNPAAIFGHWEDVKGIAACRALLERVADLRQYTTEAAAADIDDVRASLGYERITLLGASYGTRLAQAYARRFANRVRAIVLDGVLPFDVRVPLTFAATAQHSFDRLAQRCATDPACRRTHPRLASNFAQLVARLDAGPLPATVSGGGGPVTVAMTRGDFGYAVRGLLYDEAAFETLPDMINRAVQSGDLSDFAQAYWRRRVRFDDALALGMYLSVVCAEDVPFIRDAEIESASTGTFLGRYLVDEYRAACAIWPRGAVPVDVHAPLTVRVQSLLISGGFDPVTPPAFADRVAQALPAARSILSPYTAHGSAAACARPAVLHVLTGGTPETMPAVCR